MAEDGTGARGSGGPATDGEVTDFISLLNELKASGCNLLVVGDARPRLFTRASASLLGDPQSLRYRLVAITDASPRSVVERLPEPQESPRPLAETTQIINHAAAPRSVTTAEDSTVPSTIADVPETRIADPQLQGLQSALLEDIDGLARKADGFGPAKLRICVDSLATLLDHHGDDVVRQCIRTVGQRVCEHAAMAHYVLPTAYDSERVQALAGDFDAIIELRSVNPDEYGHDAQQRWHVPNRDLAMDWVRL